MLTGRQADNWVYVWVCISEIELFLASCNQSSLVINFAKIRTKQRWHVLNSVMAKGTGDNRQTTGWSQRSVKNLAAGKILEVEEAPGGQRDVWRQMLGLVPVSSCMVERDVTFCPAFLHRPLGRDLETKSTLCWSGGAGSRCEVGGVKALISLFLK